MENTKESKVTEGKKTQELIKDMGGLIITVMMTIRVEGSSTSRALNTISQ